MEIWFPAILFSTFALIIIGSLVFAHRAAATLRREFPAWAATLGWQAKPMTGWRCTTDAAGTYRDRTGRAYSYSTGSGKSRSLWAAIEITARGTTTLELSFQRQGLLTRLAEFTGVREVQVGDAAFDARWFIRTNQPEFVKAALLPDIRARINTLADAGGRNPRIEFTAGRAIYAEQGTFTAATRERAAHALPLLQDFAILAELHWESGAKPPA